MRRWGPLLTWALVMMMVGLLPLAVGWGHLPDPVATHWGVDGAPNDRLPLIVVPLLQVGLIGLALFTTSLFRVEGEPTAEAFAMVGLIGGLGLALNTSLVYLNWDAPTWDQAGDFAWWQLLLVLAGVFVGGLAGNSLGRRLAPVREALDTDGPVLEVSPGERVSWVGQTSVRWPLLLLGGAALVYLMVPGWGMWLGAVFVILGLGLTHVEANVNNQGLIVRLGGIPVRRIDLAELSSARAIDLEPTEWGGWGWRAAPNGSAIVLRRGDALELTFRGGRRFAVTVDDAATGAALLNGLLVNLTTGE